MLIKCNSHDEFKQFLQEQIPLLWYLHENRLQSLSNRLIPEPFRLILSCASLSLRTDSSPYGVKVCDCKRRFSDPEASWGWDSYRNEYYYGFSPYVFTCFYGRNKYLKWRCPLKAGSRCLNWYEVSGKALQHKWQNPEDMYICC
jgi:hypothetical protein